MSLVDLIEPNLRETKAFILGRSLPCFCYVLMKNADMSPSLLHKVPSLPQKACSFILFRIGTEYADMLYKLGPAINRIRY